MSRFDYLIAGTGLSGLSLAINMLDAGLLESKNLLLIDSAAKTENDRTWGFWSLDGREHWFDPLIAKTWSQASFKSDDFNRVLDLKPYSYHLIRGIDFYNFTKEKLQAHSGVTFLTEQVTGFRQIPDGVSVQCKNAVFDAAWVFSSISPGALTAQKGRHYLLQHFRGWVIETEEDVFDSSHAGLFDFRVQHNSANLRGGNTFVYTLATSPRRALVEYTVFSKSLLPGHEYDEGLEAHLRLRYEGMKYKILEVENGVIPMSNHRFEGSRGRLVFLGSAAGLTKASSGFTFSFVQKHAQAICQSLIETGSPLLKLKQARRFAFYDGVFLRLLSEGRLTAEDIFARLFKKNKAATVLRFLDNESSLPEEIRMMASLQTGRFMLAGIKECMSEISSEKS